MDDITTRAIIIGVNIFVTITIVSLVIIMFSQMGDIYGVVANTDTSIASRFDDIYSMYNGRTETGVGLLNTIKQFEEDNEYLVVIKYPKSNEIRTYLEDYNKSKNEENKKREAEYLKELIQNEKKAIELYGRKYRYEDKYNVTVSESENGILEINFDEVN